MLILFYIALERPICVNLMGDSKQGSREKKKKGFHGNCKYDIFPMLNKLILYLFYVVDIFIYIYILCNY